MLYVIQFCWQLMSLILLASCMTHTGTIVVFIVKNSWWWTEELSDHVEFYSKNKFEKLLHLVGFVIRIYHDARSPECHSVWLLFYECRCIVYIIMYSLHYYVQFTLLRIVYIITYSLHYYVQFTLLRIVYIITYS